MNPVYQKQLVTIYQGDALDVLRELPAASVNCIMTSPPYWGLRDYGTATWEGGDPDCTHEVGRFKYDTSDKQKSNAGSAGHQARDICPDCGAKRIDQQLGLEKTFQEYISKLCDIFDEGKRVLADNGTCWVNLGDTFSQGGGNQVRDNKNLSNSAITRAKTPNFTSKCLMIIPFRFAIEMVDRGWILRNVIIWHKPNCMPSSIKDRFTVDFEYIFFFSKSKRYWFKQQFDDKDYSEMEYRNQLRQGKEYNTEMEAPSQRWTSGPPPLNYEGRNKRCVWTVQTKPFPEAHFAVYPEEICEIPILAGCPVNGVVLDLFMGSGTTNLKASKLKRKSIGIDLKQEFIDIAIKRIEEYRTGLSRGELESGQQILFEE